VITTAAAVDATAAAATADAVKLLRLAATDFLLQHLHAARMET
jgi:hypothetical protein